MTNNNDLTVVVNPELTLDAGRVEYVDAGEESHCLVQPPEKPLFVQLFDYLSERAAPAGYVSFRMEALVLANLCLRWGSYLAVLADPNKPVHPLAKDQSKSQIRNAEMMRINIEASAALALWLDLRRSDWRRYHALLSCALELLPLTPRRLRGEPKGGFFAGISRAGDQHAEMHQVDEETAALVNRYPARAFANALLNYAWRNNSGVEDIHAGHWYPASLTFRRIRTADLRTILHATGLNFFEGLDVLNKYREDEEWSKITLPYYSSPARWIIQVDDWTCTDQSCPMKLYGTQCF